LLLLGTPAITGSSAFADDDTLEHDPEKWIPVFGKRSCSSNNLERDGDSKKRNPALGLPGQPMSSSISNLFPSPAAGPFGRRLKHARGTRIPVTIVTGFLGAGKTTLVRHFLAQPEGRGTAVIVNEFGTVGIDDALVRASTDAVTLLGNGCLCCTTRTDLQIALRRLVMERDRGELPRFERVLIETSGLADPGPILQTFATDRALGGEFFVEVVAAVVDASCGPVTLDGFPEARKQAMLADRLIVSKSDLCGAEDLARLKARLAKLNGRAAIEIATAGALDPRSLIEAVAVEPAARSGFIADEAEHSEGIGSFVLTETTPIDWRPFEHAMETLIALRGADLLRVKGLLAVAGCHGPVLIQIVQHLAHPPVELASWPDEDRTSRLVFITRNITQEQVRGLLEATRALKSP
jgi:G3E family GTPase